MASAASYMACAAAPAICRRLVVAVFETDTCTRGRYRVQHGPTSRAITAWPLSKQIGTCTWLASGHGPHVHEAALKAEWGSVHPEP